MDEKMDLNQLWADEMDGKVPIGTYHKELLKQYPDRKMEKDKDLEDYQKRDTLVEQLSAHIKELEAELQKEEQAHTMSVYDLNIRIAGLEKGVEGVLNQKHLISFAIQKQLEELIRR